MRHYRVDMSDVRRRTHRDAEREREEAEDMGFYTYNVFEIIPLSSIVHTDVWRLERYERVTEAIRKNIALPAIQVDKQGPRFTIGDGIHRYNASRDAGMTHIPAIYAVVVEAPELYKQPEQEKPALTAGAWVKLRDPRKLGATSPWARVDEVLGDRVVKGVKRHLYALVGIVDEEPEFIGDILDSEFEAFDAPSAQAEGVLKRWMTASPRRVARRFIGRR